MITIGCLLFSLERFDCERDPFRCPLRIKFAQIRIIITEPLNFMVVVILIQRQNIRVISF